MMNAASSRRLAAGFTLIELMVVIFIAAILAASAIPAFQSIRKGNALRTGIRQVAASLDFARQQAITRRQNTRFVVVAHHPQNEQQLRNRPLLREHADKVLSAYAVCTVNGAGEVVQYVRPWEYLPEGVVADVTHPASSFAGSVGWMRFPDSLGADNDKLLMNYIEFKPTGAAKEGRTLVLSRGSVLAARDADGIPTGRYDFRVNDTNVVWKAIVNNITGRVRVEEVVAGEG